MFYGVGVVLVRFGAVLPMFCFMNCFFSLPKLSPKNSLDVRSGVFGLFSLLLWFFFADVVVLFVFVSFFLSREKAQVVTGHTPTRTCVSVLFFCVPAATGFISRFGRASFPSGVLSGCHSGPRAFFGFSRDFSEAFFSDARRQGCFFASCALFCDDLADRTAFAGDKRHKFRAYRLWYVFFAGVF